MQIDTDRETHVHTYPYFTGLHTCLCVLSTNKQHSLSLRVVTNEERTGSDIIHPRTQVVVISEFRLFLLRKHFITENPAM